MISYDLIWARLMELLEPGTKIANWTAFSGHLGDYMSITDVSLKAIRVYSPGAKHIVSVPKSEIRTVWLVWDDYKAQRLRRSELAEMTRFSKYAISILHWFEEQEGADDESERSGATQLGLWIQDE